MRKKGWLVIFERFPLVGLFDFPNTLYKLDIDKWGNKPGKQIIRKCLVKIAKVIDDLEEPDLTFLLVTDLKK